MSGIIGEPGSGTADLIKDATTETFEQDVITASMSVPVIVDFWAEWCGPCKQIAPALENAVLASKGSVRLVKVDIDKNQLLASQLRIQSIPTVYAFFQGRPVDGFQGAVPESEIKAFVERLLQMPGVAETGAMGPDAEEFLTAGQEALNAGDIAAAIQMFGQAAQLDPENVAAVAGIARCQMMTGEIEQARQTMEMVPEDKRSDPAVASVLASLSLAADGDGGDVASLQRTVEQNPEDLAARFSLASALISANELDEAVGQLLEIVAVDREWEEDKARKKLLTVFEALGATHPITVSARRRLSSILFS